jgi:hypothetical protein
VPNVASETQEKDDFFDISDTYGYLDPETLLNEKCPTLFLKP